MKFLKTVAFVIDENSYSFAVAILKPVFATIPLSDVMGCYVVINQPNVQFTHNEEVQTLTLSASWMDKSMFFELYEPADTLNTFAFTEVTAIS